MTIYDSLSIKNFRTFKELKLTGLKQINLITGSNGAGKTALLEALFMLCGATNANLALSLQQFRNVQILPGSSKPFISLFHHLDTNQKIQIEAVLKKSETIKKPKKKPETITLEISPIMNKSGISAAAEPLNEVTGITSQFNGPNGRGKGSVEWIKNSFPKELSNLPPGFGPPEHSLSVQNDSINNFVPGYFISPYFRDVWQQTYQLLNDVIKNRKKQDLIKIMKVIEPRLIDLQPLTEKGQQEIYVDLGDDFLPLPLMGSGFCHALRLALEAGTVQGGIVLIDEPEDGIYYKILPDIIKFIIETSKNNVSQIFITTHSSEFISMFSTTSISMNFDDVGLINLRRGPNGAEGVCYDFNEVKVSEEIDAELR